MGRSQETFSKKEREKKKLVKRQDKEQKREERKANTDKGKSLEEMMAYVDENGNITNTPPDPKKRRIIEVENIRIGIEKQVPLSPEELIRKGIITRFNHEKGYGFIKDKLTGDSLFVHIKSISGEFKENDEVTFEAERGPKGMNAVNVKVG